MNSTLAPHLHPSTLTPSPFLSCRYAYPDSAWGTTSSLLQCMEALGAPARWTCAWKSVFFKRVLGEPAPDPANPMSVFVCGDDKEAKVGGALQGPIEHHVDRHHSQSRFAESAFCALIWF